jgi:hypothetical protein
MYFSGIDKQQEVTQNNLQWHKSTNRGKKDKFKFSKFEFRGSFGMVLERDWREVEVTPNLELLVLFGTSLEGVCHELYTWFHYEHIPNLKL